MTQPSRRLALPFGLLPTLQIAALCIWSLSLLACSDDKPTQCRFVGQRQLTENSVSQLANARLLPVADGFVLAGLDGPKVHWATLSNAGVLGAPSTFAVGETTVIAPQLAVTSRVTPGDQIVAVYAVSGPENAIVVRAVTQVAGEAASTPQTLATFPAGLGSADVKLAVGSSRSGLRALVAWGVANQAGAKINVRSLGADGSTVGDVLQVDPGESWRCLQFVPSRTDWALAWVRAPVTDNWRLVLEEGQDAGNIVARYTVGMSTKDTTCPLVAASSRGYVFGFQADAGTWVTDYEIASGQVRSEFVVSAVRWGDPEVQPPVGAVASMGYNWAVMFGVAKGPEVWLFDSSGAHEGSRLKLPANGGAIGPVSSASAAGAFYTTYREGTTPGPGPRWFMKVECPSG